MAAVSSSPVAASTAALAFRAVADVPPVVVLAGEETFLAEEAVAAIAKALFPAGDPGGAIVALDAGNPADAERLPAVLEELATASLFGDGKLVIVRRAELLGGKGGGDDEDDDPDGDGEDDAPAPKAAAVRPDFERTSKVPAAAVPKGRRLNPITALVKVATAAPVDGSVLVVATSKPVKGKGSVSGEAILKTGAMLVDCRRLYDAPPPWSRGGPAHDTEVSQWVVKRAKVRHGKAMDLRTGHALALRLGAGLAGLSRAVETLASYVGARPAITEADVAATVGETREDPTWVLADAVLDRDLERALKLVAQSFERGLSDAKGRVSVKPDAIFPPLVATLAGAWRRAMLVAEAGARGENPATIAAFAGLPGFVVERLVRQAARRDPDDLLVRHRAFVDAESGVRGGGVPPRLAVERLVIALVA